MADFSLLDLNKLVANFLPNKILFKEKKGSIDTWAQS